MGLLSDRHSSPFGAAATSVNRCLAERAHVKKVLCLRVKSFWCGGRHATGHVPTFRGRTSTKVTLRPAVGRGANKKLEDKGLFLTCSSRCKSSQVKTVRSRPCRCPSHFEKRETILPVTECGLDALPKPRQRPSLVRSTTRRCAAVSSPTCVGKRDP